MKQLRWIAVAVVLALVCTTPMYAACGQCEYREQYDRDVCIVYVPFPTTCFGGYNVAGNPCVQYATPCGYGSIAELSDTYSVASVEVTRPDGVKQVTPVEPATAIASHEVRN
ncbi:MAG TPA: hypothetical protein VF618_05040 [Thermoanaerobaculia bacterium]